MNVKMIWVKRRNEHVSSPVKSQWKEHSAAMSTSDNFAPLEVIICLILLQLLLDHKYTLAIGGTGQLPNRGTTKRVDALWRTATSEDDVDLETITNLL